MNVVIQGYLDRFVRDFELDSAELSDNFEKFCIYSLLKNELIDLDENDMEEMTVGKNKGIDAICFSIDGNAITNLKEVVTCPH